MENVTKALLMAAGVLLGVLMLTLMVYVFTRFAGFTTSQAERQRVIELNMFNTKFLEYDKRRINSK